MAERGGGILVVLPQWRGKPSPDCPAGERLLSSRESALLVREEYHATHRAVEPVDDAEEYCPGLWYFSAR